MTVIETSPPPNRMRGQITSMFLFVANLLGVGLGPAFVAMITDYVFHDEHAVGHSIAVATVVITPITISFLWWGLRPFRESLARAGAWS